MGLSPATSEHFQGPDDHGTHITCDLPCSGARVWVRSAENRCGAHLDKRVEGNATVRTHWHYDGCVLDVDMDDGTKAAVYPDFGDDVVPLARRAEPTVLKRPHESLDGP